MSLFDLSHELQYTGFKTVQYEWAKVNSSFENCTREWPKCTLACQPVTRLMGLASLGPEGL